MVLFVEMSHGAIAKSDFENSTRIFKTITKFVCGCELANLRLAFFELTDETKILNLQIRTSVVDFFELSD